MGPASRLLLALALLLAAVAARPAAAQAPGDPRFFAETGFRIDSDAFWSYFHARGGIANFGYPVSHAFALRGTPVQIFQRRVLQLNGDGSVGQLNLLDPGLMPYTSFNQAVFPAPDPAVIGAAPPATDADAVLAFVRQVAPDVFEGRPVRFFSTFQNTVPLSVAFPFGGGSPGLLLGINLEMWGVPTSRPAADPNKRQLRLPALAARDHALRRRLQLHPGHPARRLLRVDPDRPEPVGRPGPAGRREPVPAPVQQRPPRRPQQPEPAPRHGAARRLRAAGATATRSTCRSRTSRASSARSSVRPWLARMARSRKG